MGIPFCLETRAAPLSEVKMINVLLAIPSWLISCMISPKTKKIVEEGYLMTLHCTSFKGPIIVQKP